MKRALKPFVTVLFLCLALAACDADPEADIAAGTEAYLMNDFDRAHALWEPLALAGNEEAAGRLAFSVMESDSVRALSLAQPAIDSGLPIGRLLAAAFEYQGIGRKKSEENAISAFRSLAKCGMPIALNAYSVIRKARENRDLYNHGELRDLENAALSGLSIAQFNVAMNHFKERKEDYVYKSLAWLKLAAERDHPTSIEMLESLNEKGLPFTAENIANEIFERLKGSLDERYPFECSSDH